MKKLLFIFILFIAQNALAQNEPAPVLRDYSKQKKKLLKREKEKIKEVAKAIKKKKKYKEIEEGEVDHPELALQQDFELTKDPATGTVPIERLEMARDVIHQQALQRGTQPTIANWVERGPSNVGGRTRTIMFDPNDITKKKVWAGGVGGGLWYTNDITIATPTWINVSEVWANTGITTMAFNPANTQEFYVGTGEGWGNADAARGAGIWKTADGGTTWTQLTSTSTSNNFDYVQKIVVTSTGTVYAACKSRFCNRGGLFKSTNGGSSWTLSLGTQGSTCASSNTNAADIEIGADGTLYASMGMFSTGSIHRSNNDGSTWSQLNNATNGFPNSGLSRIEIATAPSDANRLYAMVQNSNTNTLLNIYTSNDKGTTWTTCALPTWYDQSCGSPTNDMTRTQAWYDLILAVDPNNPQTIYAGGVDIMKSSNAGSTWTQISSWAGACGRQYVHADQHAITFQPGSSSVAVFGNDGGIFYTTNSTATIPTLVDKNYGYNVTQFYACAINPNAGSNNYLAGAQDNGTQQFTTPGINATGDITGGDGAYCFIDQTDGNVQITSYVYNNYYMTTDNWNTYAVLSSSSNTGSFINPADYDDVNNILFSGHSVGKIQRVLNVGPSPSSPSQITITGMTGSTTHLRVSPFAPMGTSTVYVGTNTAQLFKVSNAQGTASFTNLSSASFPGGSISCVEIGATENDLLVTFSNYGVTSVYRSTDGGITWANKEGNLPDMPVRWAMYNPKDRTEVFLATELGIWSCTDITQTTPNWIANNNGLSNVRVTMFQLRNSDNFLIASTHGRGLYSSSAFCLAPSITTQPGSPIVTCNGIGTQILNVVASGSNLTYQWKRNGVAISNNAVYSGVNAANLILTNTTLSQVGNYTVTIFNSCLDSVTSNPVNVNVAVPTSSTSNITRCSNQLPFNWNGNSYSSQGVYTKTLVNSNGCDSVATLVLNINSTSSSSTSITSCNNYTWNGVTYSTSGTYNKTGFINTKGCDSIATLLLTINQPTSSLTIISACNNYTWNGITYNTSGTYIKNGLTNSKGCDSSATLQLIINNPTSSTLNLNACNSYTWNAVTYTSSGTYTKSGLTNSKGCDSVAILNLTINNSTSSSSSFTACNSYTWNGIVYTSSGSYTKTGLINSKGCDSIATLILTIKKSTASSTSVTATGNYTWNNITYNASGNYTYTTLNSQGCDSIATLILTINPITTLSLAGANSVCVGSSIQLTANSSGGVWSSIAGRATVSSTGLVTGSSGGIATIKYVKGALSVTKNITVNVLPPVPSIAYAPGSPNPQAGCTSGLFGKNRTFTLVGSLTPGVWSATGQVTVTSAGVATTTNNAGAGSLTYTHTNANGCSSSRTISGVVGNCASSKSIANIAFSESLLSIYPNPAKDFITISTREIINNSKLIIVDVLGKVVHQQIMNQQAIVLNKKLVKGIYFVKLNNEVEKLIVE